MGFQSAISELCRFRSDVRELSKKYALSPDQTKALEVLSQRAMVQIGMNSSVALGGIGVL